MKRHARMGALATALSLTLLTLAALAQQETKTNLDPREQQLQKLAEEIHSQILRLPEYGVFDSIHFAIKADNSVTLLGYASRPILRSAAESVVKRIEGVTQVHNEIEVLPVSANDDRIRAAVYASIYGFSRLQRYTSNRGGAARIQRNSVARRAGGITNDPPIGWHAIRIIVKNGNVTLMGVVDNDADFAVAGMRANLVPGVFSVDNNLQVANRGA